MKVIAEPLLAKSPAVDRVVSAGLPQDAAVGHDHLVFFLLYLNALPSIPSAGTAFCRVEARRLMRNRGPCGVGGTP
jgi:hypothetical protein